ncbi:MAG: hypothetical protein Q7T18_04075 [Sedimentisphaerales bacterium]|nr:hypothetical protein [Sedimentisphaerales bacterium]
MKRLFFAGSLMLVTLSFVGCATTAETALESDSQVKLRSIQSRRFETCDKTKALRTAIATLQDLGFVIDKADNTLGTVSATKLSGYNMRMTVSVRPSGDKELIVRANAQYNLKAVENPEPYQQFFAAYEKAMFLTAHSVD